MIGVHNCWVRQPISIHVIERLLHVAGAEARFYQDKLQTAQHWVSNRREILFKIDHVFTFEIQPDLLLHFRLRLPGQRRPVSPYT